MMKRVYKTVWIGCMVLIGTSVFAQEGGPPMLTDDARVTDLKEWEVNTSINTSVTDLLVLSTPHIDLNYGIAPNLQLKAEAPFVLQFDKGAVSNQVGEIILGVKFRFLHEEKHFISAATFPQVTVNREKGYLIPVFFEKTIGRFLLGEAIGYFAGVKSGDNLQLGTLLGYRATEKLHLMLEYFSQQEMAGDRAYNGYINFGFRHPINNHLGLMGSFGTQIVTPTGLETERFISWLGIQTIL